MVFDKLENYTRGWVIGNFNPSLLKTEGFEVGVLHHESGDYIEPHYQKTATEYNIIVEGSLMVNNNILGPGDIFVYDPFEVADVEILSKSTVVVIKTPSVGASDKVVVPNR